MRDCTKDRRWTEPVSNPYASHADRWTERMLVKFLLVKPWDKEREITVYQKDSSEGYTTTSLLLLFAFSFICRNNVYDWWGKNSIRELYKNSRVYACVEKKTWKCLDTLLFLTCELNFPHRRSKSDYKYYLEQHGSTLLSSFVRFQLELGLFIIF